MSREINKQLTHTKYIKYWRVCQLFLTLSLSYPSLSVLFSSSFSVRINWQDRSDPHTVYQSWVCQNQDHDLLHGIFVNYSISGVCVTTAAIPMLEAMRKLPTVPSLRQKKLCLHQKVEAIFNIRSHYNTPFMMWKMQSMCYATMMTNLQWPPVAVAAVVPANHLPQVCRWFWMKCRGWEFLCWSPFPPSWCSVNYGMNMVNSNPWKFPNGRNCLNKALGIKMLKVFQPGKHGIIVCNIVMHSVPQPINVTTRQVPPVWIVTQSMVSLS